MASRARPRPEGWALPGLGAAGPAAGQKDKLNLFGQFIGDWRIERWWVEPGGSEQRNTGWVYFRWILGGSAIQDIWSAAEGDPPRERPIGTTIRFPNLEGDTWTSLWIAPDRGLLRRFVARKVGEEIDLATTKEDGCPERWVFSDIAPTSFRWRAEDSRDGGMTWTLTEEMRIRRQTEGAGP